jgi:hypothetical protein
LTLKVLIHVRVRLGSGSNESNWSVCGVSRAGLWPIIYIQGVSRLVDITAGAYFLGLCDQNVNINMCSILDGYGVTGIF